MITWMAFVFLAGLDATSPSADHSAEVMSMAPAQADVFVYVDAEALVQPSWRYMRDRLAAEPVVAGSPELASQIAAATVSIDKGLAEAATSLGVHPIDDLDRVALWLDVREVQGDEPVDFGLTVVVWGEFETDTLETLASNAGWESNVGPSGPTTYRGLFDGVPLYAAQLADDQIFIGTEAELTARLDGSFVAAARPDGSLLALQEQKLAAGAIAVFSVAPGKPLAQAITAATDTSTSARDMLTGFDHLQVSLFADGLDLDVDATSTALARRYAELAGGLIDVLEAGRSGVRGLTRIALAALSKDDPAYDDAVTALLRDTDATMAFVERFTGTTSLAVQDRSRVQDGRVSLEVRAGHLRELLVPLMLAGAVTLL